GATALHEINHRGEGGFAGLFATEVPEELLLRRREAIAGRKDEVGPEQGPRLLFNGALQIAAQRTDGGQRDDAEDNRERKQQEPFSTRPAIAPSHAPRPGGEQMRGETAGGSRDLGWQRL